MNLRTSMSQYTGVRLVLWLAPLLLCVATTVQAAELSVSPDKRYLLKDGKPFFFLCDTGSDVFLRLDRKETDVYLQNRADKGFNVIMAILIGWQPNKDERNAYGEPPLIGRDPARPNDKYFKHVDYVVNKANSLGMFVAITPSWSDLMYKNVPPGPHLFNVENARSFGKYVGRRYRDNDVIWVIGGDRDPSGYEDILRAMVAGLDEGDGDRDFLMTFHGQRIGKPILPDKVYFEKLCSSHLMGAESWLDFHGAYSGHQWAYPTYRLTKLDRAMKPTRPVIDLEPCFENHAYHPDGSRYWASPGTWNGKTRGTPAMIREQAYWAMLAGAAGHTYAAQDVWQFYDKKKNMPHHSATTHWHKAMDFPGAVQMGIMRRLFESRPWQQMEPDQSIIAAGQGRGENHVQAARDSDGRFLFAYIPRGNKLTIDMTKVKASKATAFWFNPRNGEATRIGVFPCRDKREFSPPSQGVDNDWVLVLDDATQNFPMPGVTGRNRSK